MNDETQTLEPKLTASHTPVTVDAKTKKASKGKPRSIAFSYNFGCNIHDAIARFGEANVFKLFREAAEADVIAEAKRLLAPGRNNTSLRLDKEIHDALAAYHVGTDQAAIERAERFRETLAAMTPEALAAAGIVLNP